MGRAWAVGQARSPGQPGTVARRAKLGPARSSRARPGGPFAHLYPGSKRTKQGSRSCVAKANQCAARPSSYGTLRSAYTGDDELMIDESVAHW